MKKYNLVYCHICSGCGEDSCCSAINCEMDEDGLYCDTYLKELKFGYSMYRSIIKEFPKILDDKRFDEILDSNYNKFWKPGITDKK